MEELKQNYFDYKAFSDSLFSSTSFANALVLATNNSSDQYLDLATPLSRVLFDAQEVDTRIDSLAHLSALSMIDHTKSTVEAGVTILDELEKQVSALVASYDALQFEVLARNNIAVDTCMISSRLWQTLRLGRAITRCLTLARQSEIRTGELKTHAISGVTKENSWAMVRSANTILLFRQMLEFAKAGDNSTSVDRIHLVRSLERGLISSNEQYIISHAEQVISQFSVVTRVGIDLEAASRTDTQNSSIYMDIEAVRSTAISAMTTLYLLSPLKNATSSSTFEPSLLITCLQEYIKRSLTSSLAGLTNALTNLSKLERTLMELSARCQNILALEYLLRTVKPPPHPLFEDRDNPPENGTLDLLHHLLASLDTNSLASYFWRSMASQMTSRVQKILRDGGISARTLRGSKDRIRDALKLCVLQGSKLPFKPLDAQRLPNAPNYEREAAVMVGSVVNILGRS